MKIIKLNKMNIFQKSARGLALIALFLMPALFLPISANASIQDQLNNVTNQLEQTKDKLEETQTQKKTLAGEVASFDKKISAVQGQIYSADAEIQRINGDITATQTKIKDAEAELAKNRSYLSEFLRIAYEEGQTTELELIAMSRNFSDFVDRSEYLSAMQLKVKDSADKVIGLKNELESKKKQLEDNKKRAEELKQQQVAQKQELGAQRASKDLLLEETKGDEAAYQALVKKLQSQADQLQRSLWSNNGNYVSLGTVNKGDIIGYIGNSGFSTGPHLHFEVRTGDCYGCHVNPMSYIGNGYFDNPVPGVWVSQYYGSSSWTSAYSFHTGVDFADGGRGTPIRAAADGEIVQRVSGRPNTYSWSVEYGNYVKIRHTNGMYTLYGHMR